MNLSIFAKNPFRHKRDGHLMRCSSIIRGEQIATFIGAKLNPSKGYENDVCIYVKPHIKPGYEFVFEGKPYLDIIDGRALIETAKKHRHLPVIACSKWSAKYLSRLVNNKIILHLSQ